MTMNEQISAATTGELYRIIGNAKAHPYIQTEAIDEVARRLENPNLDPVALYEHVKKGSVPGQVKAIILCAIIRLNPAMIGGDVFSEAENKTLLHLYELAGSLEVDTAYRVRILAEQRIKKINTEPLRRLLNETDNVSRPRVRALLSKLLTERQNKETRQLLPPSEELSVFKILTWGRAQVGYTQGFRLPPVFSRDYQEERDFFANTVTAQNMLQKHGPNLVADFNGFVKSKQAFERSQHYERMAIYLNYIREPNREGLFLPILLVELTKK